MVLFFKVKISWLFGFKDSFNRENEESIYFQSNLFNAFFTALKKCEQNILLQFRFISLKSTFQIKFKSVCVCVRRQEEKREIIFHSMSIINIQDLKRTFTSYSYSKVEYECIILYVCRLLSLLLLFCLSIYMCCCCCVSCCCYYLV